MKLDKDCPGERLKTGQDVQMDRLAAVRSPVVM